MGRGGGDCAKHNVLHLDTHSHFGRFWRFHWEGGTKEFGDIVVCIRANFTRREGGNRREANSKERECWAIGHVRPNIVSHLL